MKFIRTFENYDPQVIFKNRELDIDFLHKIEIPPNSKILDISYGNGRESNYLSSLGHDVYSTELTDRFSYMLKGPKHYTHDTKDKFPFKEKFFDIIISRLGLHYFTDSELSDIFSELKRIIKIGGKLSFSAKIEDDDIKTGKIFRSENEWKSLVENNGFKIINLDVKSGKLYEVESNWIEVYSESI